MQARRILVSDIERRVCCRAFSARPCTKIESTNDLKYRIGVPRFFKSPQDLCLYREEKLSVCALIIDQLKFALSFSI